MSETTTTAPLVVQPFEDLSRTDQISHLLTFHGYDAVLRRGRKVTKAVLESTHTDFHNRPGYIDQFGAHEHRALSSDEVEGAGDIVRSLEKPLTVSERNALKQLVDNDFDSLIKEIEGTANKVLAARVAEVNDSFADKRREAEEYDAQIQRVSATLDEEVSKAISAARDEIARITAEAAAKEITVKGAQIEASTYYRPKVNSWTITAEGEDKAVAAIKAETQRERAAARLAADRKRLAVHRQIMLAALPEAIRPLVDEIPSAKALMNEVAENKQIEA